MSSALIDPDHETFPNRHRWTVEACYRLIELGFLSGKFEVLDGEVIDKMGQKPPHAACLTRLFQILSVLFGAGHVRMQSPIELPGDDGIYTEPEPDAAVTVGAADAYDGHHPRPDDLLLVVEVGDTSLRTDLLVKSRLYAQVGIAEYWCVDLNARKIHVHQRPVDGIYTSVTVHAEPEIVAIGTQVSKQIACADLFPANEAEPGV